MHKVGRESFEGNLSTGDREWYLNHGSAARPLWSCESLGSAFRISYQAPRAGVNLNTALHKRFRMMQQGAIR